MEMDDPTATPPNDFPAGYITLTDNRNEHQSQHLLPLWHREIFKIGRDPKCNTLTIDNDPGFNVSRSHCEFYVVVYEPTVNYIYVRDRKSSNGTYVNGELIGKGPHISSGYLLENGDAIEIRPHWTFVLTQERPPPRQELSSLQIEECRLFADRYLLTNRCLGQGAEATVHLAIDAVTKKQLVCKLVNLDKIQGKNNREEIRRKFQEGDILRQLRHPNILTYIDTISSPHTLYTFTELASGGDLMSFLYRQGPVSDFDSRVIVRQVINGLEYLHGKKIIHRDLKPENILLAYSPKIGYHRVILADFGNSAVPRRSRMLTVVGTLNYQAPEILSSTKAHTEAVDIWSLGIVTLLLLCSGFEIQIEDLNRMSQTEIGKYLKSIFANPKQAPTYQGQRFLWGCLQTDPDLRMNAVDAGWHGWLQTPKKHLEAFAFLDRKMYLDWKPQEELKPMPLELPSLMVSEPALSQAPDTRCSQYFATNATLSSSTAGYPTGANGTNATAKRRSQEEPSGSHCQDDNLRSQATLKAHNLEHQNRAKQEYSGSDGFLKPVSPAQAKRKSNKKKLVVRSSETDLLPLPGLDRHLPPISSSRMNRQMVLDELEKSNLKFLVDQDIFNPRTAP